MKSIQLKETFNVSPEILYNTWLDSKAHTEMTGSQAVCSSETNGNFSAWEGYITGFNISLEPNNKIVQSWRTTEFSESDKDSELIIQISATKEGSLLTLIHSNIPEGQSDYENGWIEHYFKPMKQYFQKTKRLK